MNKLTATVLSDVVNFAGGTHLSREVKDFLKKLNVPPLKTLKPIAAQVPWAASAATEKVYSPAW